MSHTLAELDAKLDTLADPSKAKDSAWFFKTGKGEYGEGDQFLGIKVPELRKLSKQYKALDINEVQALVESKWHEKRLLAIFILVLQYQKKKPDRKKEIYDFYLTHRKHINNWDIIDSSARQIVGHYLEDKDRTLLYDFAKTGNLWERRIAVLATFWYIPKGDFQSSLEIAEILLDDSEDLIHKAMGWMLREIGKADKSAEDAFLNTHYKQMPRTMLRYAIEKYPEDERQAYLKGEL